MRLVVGQNPTMSTKDQPTAPGRALKTIPSEQASRDSFVMTHNSLNQGYYSSEKASDMDAHSLRLMAVAISKISQGQDLLNSVRVYTSELQDIFESYNKTKSLTAKVRASAEAITNLKAKILFGKGEFKLINIISDVTWKRGVFHVNFHDDAKSIFLRLTGNFTKYKLQAIATLPNAPSILLYQRLRSCAYIGTDTCTPEMLRNYLSIPLGSYARVDQLRDRVLEPAIESINLHTDINVSVQAVVHKKTVVEFVFRISLKEEAELTAFEKAAIKMLTERRVVFDAAKDLVRAHGCIAVVNSIALTHHRTLAPNKPKIEKESAFIVAVIRDQTKVDPSNPEQVKIAEGFQRTFRRSVYEHLQPEEKRAHLDAYVNDLNNEHAALWNRFKTIDSHNTLSQLWDRYLRQHLNAEAPSILLTA